MAVENALAAKREICRGSLPTTQLKSTLMVEKVYNKLWKQKKIFEGEGNLWKCIWPTSWEMKLGTNGGFKKISKSAGSDYLLVSEDPSVVMKESHEKSPSCKGRVRFLCSSPKLISQITGAPLQQCVKTWTAESQVKQGVKRYKLWRRHLHPSNLCEKLWPLTWTCQYKQTSIWPTRSETVLLLPIRSDNRRAKIVPGNFPKMLNTILR